MTLLAVVFALASAATAALSTSAQHHAATSAPKGTGAGVLLQHLVRQPTWVLALLLGPIGFTLHVLALHHGPIALVQPIVITGIVFAVPIRAAFSRAWPAASELRAVSLTAGAIAVFLLASDPSRDSAAPDPTTLLVAVACCASAAVGLIVVAHGVAHPVGAAFLLGTAAGVLFGLMAVLIKASQLHEAEHGVLALAVTWLPYALVASGVGGVAVNQLAYRSARLSASMPVLNVVNCLVAVGFGYVVFHETPSSSPAALAACVAALAVMAWGLWSLSGRDRRPPRRTSSTSSPAAPSAPARAASGY